jgi:hypothetical protein
MSAPLVWLVKIAIWISSRRVGATMDRAMNLAMQAATSFNGDHNSTPVFVGPTTMDHNPWELLLLLARPAD